MESHWDCNCYLSFLLSCDYCWNGVHHNTLTFSNILKVNLTKIFMTISKKKYLYLKYIISKNYQNQAFNVVSFWMFVFFLLHKNRYSNIRNNLNVTNTTEYKCQNNGIHHIYLTLKNPTGLWSPHWKSLSVSQQT